MASYLAYVPHQQLAGRPAPEALAAVGLEAMLDEGQAPAATPLLGGPLGVGPDGGAGVLFGWTNPAEPDQASPASYDAERQTWWPVKPDPHRKLAAGRAWIGWDRQRPPRPVDLARRTQRPGCLVALEDGHDWLIPFASALPRKLGLDADGQPSRVVLERFAQFDADARALWNYVRGLVPVDGTVEAALPVGWDYACQALAINYRLVPDLVDRLELLTDDSMARLVLATVEAVQLIELLAELQKKKPVILSATPATSNA